MGNTARLIRVFIASPGDVLAERERAEIVVSELNRDFGDALEVRLEGIRWEDYVSPLMGRPEDVVLSQVKVDEWDIFIGILWLRFGTPTGGVDRQSQKLYQSGTEEEFHIAYGKWKTTGSPQILFYRCTRSPQDMAQFDTEQYRTVQQFVSGFDHDKAHPGIVRSYQLVDEFERRLREDLSKAVRGLAQTYSSQSGPMLSAGHQAQGFVSLYLPAMNDDRNKAKRSALRRATSIRLLAHSGHSFFAAVGHRYRKELMERLEGGASFKAVLSNPWSLTGLFISLSEAEQVTGGTGVEQYGKVLKGELDPVKLIEGSNWYSIKYRDSVRGYNQLAPSCENRMHIRLTRFDLPATILLTDVEGSFEPYMNVNLPERTRVGMMTCELRMEAHSSLYRHASSYFEFMWSVSEDYETFLAKEETYKRELASRITQ